MTDLSQEQPQEKQYQVGRTSATERDAITSDKIFFWLTPGVIVNPFDIMSVGQINQPDQSESRTYGLVTTLEHRTDARGHLDNYISSNFGQLEEVPNTVRQGTTVATVSVLSNSQDVYMPVPSDKIVRFAQPKEVQQALGMDGVAKENLIPAGLIKMTNGVSTPIYLDRQFVLGPEGGHVNISGISGLATKTSYAMFLLQSILQTASDSSKIAVILLNVKQADLLQIDKPDMALSEEQKGLWREIGLEPKPFENVRYLLPRNKDGKPSSFPPIPKNYMLYAYDLEGAADKLDLLLSNASDPSGTIEGICGEIMSGVQNGDGELKAIRGWNLLLDFLEAKQKQGKWKGLFAPASIGMFRRHLRSVVQTYQTGIFPESRSRNEKLVGEELANIEGGSTYVVDIAKLADPEQTLVFGDILKTIYEVKDGTSEARTTKASIPDKVIVFVDELNKYAPSGGKESPITRQVLEVAERGRSLGVILISAQQFMSAVHPRVTGNSATKIIGRTGSSELNAPDYRFLDQDIRSAVTRLVKGDLLISHAIYRQPVKVTFPRAAYRQQQTEEPNEGES